MAPAIIGSVGKKKHLGSEKNAVSVEEEGSFCWYNMEQESS